MHQLLEEEDNDDEFYTTHYGEDVFKDTSSDYNTNEEGTNPHTFILSSTYICSSTQAILAPCSFFAIMIPILCFIAAPPSPPLPLISLVDSGDEFDTDFTTEEEEDADAMEKAAQEAEKEAAETVCVCVCVCVCVFVYKYIYMCLCINIYICLCMFNCLHLSVYM